MSAVYPNLVKATKAWRNVNGINLDQFAEMIGLTRMSVHNKLTGKTDFTLPEAVQVCSIIGMSIDDAVSNNPIEIECKCEYAIGGSD